MINNIAKNHPRSLDRIGCGVHDKWYIPMALFNWVPMDASSGEVEALFWVSGVDMPDASADR